MTDTTIKVMAQKAAKAALIQKEVLSLFRHSISRRPTVWPQVIVVDPAAPAATDME